MSRTRIPEQLARSKAIPVARYGVTGFAPAISVSTTAPCSIVVSDAPPLLVNLRSLKSVSK